MLLQRHCRQSPNHREVASRSWPPSLCHNQTQEVWSGYCFCIFVTRGYLGTPGEGHCVFASPYVLSYTENEKERKKTPHTLDDELKKHKVWKSMNISIQYLFVFNSYSYVLSTTLWQAQNMLFCFDVLILIVWYSHWGNCESLNKPSSIQSLTDIEIWLRSCGLVLNSVLMMPQPHTVHPIIHLQMTSSTCPVFCLLS